MNIPVFTLAALVAIFPLSGFAQDPTLGCLLDGVQVVGEGDPPVIEGDGNANTIDCSSSLGPYRIYGYGGDDLLIGSAGNDFIAGGGGNDTILGGAGDDAIDGGATDDWIYGEEGNDLIFGGVGASPAAGVGCVPESLAAFIALGSSYLTKGGSGDDIIFGGAGNDCIDAGSGEDFAYGGPGNDILEGGNHNDLLHGGAGEDYLEGGWHTDTCISDDEDDVESPINCEIELDGSSEPPDCGDGTCNDFTGETPCTCFADCGAPESLFCGDYADNDCDENTDCDDTDCSGDSVCEIVCTPIGDEICNSGQDEDCDGSIDCTDSDCDSDPDCGSICSLSDSGESCTSNSECCSNKCRGKPGSKTCR